jgi:hypothetical protein
LKFIEILIAGKEFCFDGNIKLVSQEFSLLGVCPWELQLDLRGERESTLHINTAALEDPCESLK